MDIIFWFFILLYFLKGEISLPLLFVLLKRKELYEQIFKFEKLPFTNFLFIISELIFCLGPKDIIILIIYLN